MQRRLFTTGLLALPAIAQTQGAHAQSAPLRLIVPAPPGGSTDILARILIERYGPAAHPARCVTLRCEEIPSLVELTRRTDALLIAVRAVGTGLMELPMKPPMQATAARMAG